MTRLILFLVRLKLGVKKNEHFRFDNQKTDNVYFITPYEVLKVRKDGLSTIVSPSNVSINWLVNPMCRVKKV